MRRTLAAWNRFWFTPRSTSTAALVRIAGGLVLLAWTATVGRDVLAFFGPEAILSKSPDYKLTGLKGIWSVLGRSPGSALVIAVYVAMLIGAVCLVVGYHSRLAALVVFVAMVSFTRRDPLVFNSGDALLRALTFYLLLVPGEAALSLDRRRLARKRGEDFWAFPTRAVWPIRLLQIQLSVAYLTAVWDKAGGASWREGSAVAYALHVGFLLRLPVPGVIARSLLASNVLSYTTLAIELAVGLLVWNSGARSRVLWAGVALHLGIDYAFRVGFFSYAMFVLYLAFIPPETVDAWLSAGRARWSRRRARRSPDREEQPMVDEVGPAVMADEDAASVATGAEGADVVVGEASPGVARG